MIDEIGSAHMAQGNLTTFTTDRFGCLNSALALNGGWTQVASGVYFDTLEFTISVWIFPQQVDPWARIIDFSNGASSDNICFTISRDFLQPSFILISGSIEVIASISSQNLTLNKWHFLTVSFNGTNARIYLNGTLTADYVNKFIPKSLTRKNCWIGKSAWNIRNGDGYSYSFIDDLRFYNKSLSQAEINDLLNFQSSNSI